MSFFQNRNNYYNRGGHFGQNGQHPYPQQGYAYGYPQHPQYPHPQHPQMQRPSWWQRQRQMQNVPRGTYPSYPPQQPMPTMPQMPQQHGQMPIPPMPVPSQAPPMANAPNQQISPEAQDALIGKIQEFAQGEANSLRFYETLINLAGGQKDVILGLIESKKQTNQKASEFYTAALGMGWTAEETKIGEIGDYKNGLAYAKAQEAKLLREAANICVDMEHEKQRTYMNYILQNKIADITILNAL